MALAGVLLVTLAGCTRPPQYRVIQLPEGIMDIHEPLTVDARPSDAIALALRADCPIYVAEPVLAMARLSAAGPPDNATTDQLRKWLEGLNDEDLGRYKM